ncbi:MAG: Uma2 family endonuclease [Prochlorothrix sp.]
MRSISLNLNPVFTLTREKFYQLCRSNPDVRLERSADAVLHIVLPLGGEMSNWSSELGTDLGLWNRQTRQGKTFDSSGGFALPNGADRSPDLAWIPLEKWEALTPEQRQGFLPLCPDFVVELLSPSDSWKQGTLKMEEYMTNGCRLGWLIDPKGKRVGIYRSGQALEILDNPATLSGEDVLTGFILDLRVLWT